MERNLFRRFLPAIEGGDLGRLEIANDGRYSLQYTPFEHVSSGARLVIVGITPGPNQLDEAYATTRRLLTQGLPEQQILAEVTRIGAFSGPMRTNLVQMLDYFRIGELLGIGSAAALWGSKAQMLHSTSVVPHAAFKSNKRFAGSFDEILRVALLRECFSDCFVPSLRELSSEARYIGLGPTAADALAWCVDSGLIKNKQLIGSIPHPSPANAERIAYFCGRKAREAVSSKTDPAKLDHARDLLSARVRQLARA